MVTVPGALLGYLTVGLLVAAIIWMLASDQVEFEDRPIFAFVWLVLVWPAALAVLVAQQ